VLADQRAAPARMRWRVCLLDAGPLALAGAVANGGSVVVTVALARLLVARDYGALNQLIGVFFVVSTPGSAVLVGVVRRVTRWMGDLDAVARWGAALHRRAMLALVAFGGTVVAVGPQLARLLGRSDTLGVDAIAIAGAVWVLLCIDRGLLQAHRSYRTLSANLLLEGGARTALMVAAGAAGLGVSGVAAGVLVAELCTALHARVVADRVWRPEGDSAPSFVRSARPGRCGAPGARRTAAWRARHDFGHDRLVRRDLLAAVLALTAIAVLQYVDVIAMARAAPRAAGAYAAVSVSSKALVFVAVVVAGYLLPEAAISWRAGGHALGQLSVSLAILAVPAAVLVTVAAAVPRQFLASAFTTRYVSASGAFLPLALAMVCLSATVMVTMYLLGVGDRWFSAALAGAAVLATLAVVAAGGSPRSTALADVGVQAALLCAGAAELARVHRRRVTG